MLSVDLAYDTVLLSSTSARSWSSWLFTSQIVVLLRKAANDPATPWDVQLPYGADESFRP